MKILLLNGSPKEFGCTYTALNKMAEVFNKENFETEIFYIGTDPIASCRGCRACEKLKKCVVNDKVNEFVEKAKNSDGFIVGSPVHYASASGTIISFLDRAFYSAARSGNKVFTHKPATAIVSARRAWTSATLDQLYKYFSITQMPIISGRYWNMVHGNTPDEVLLDKEGIQNLQVVAKNMIYHLKCKEIASKNGIEPPILEEEVIRTNFIR